MQGGGVAGESLAVVAVFVGRWHMVAARARDARGERPNSVHARAMMLIARSCAWRIAAPPSAPKCLCARHVHTCFAIKVASSSAVQASLRIAGSS